MRGRIYLVSAIIALVIVLVMNGCGDGEESASTSTPKISATPTTTQTPTPVETPTSTPSPEPTPTPIQTPVPTPTPTPPPPQVQKIAFSSEREPRGTAWSILFIMNADGSGVRRLGEYIGRDSCMAFPDESYSGECKWSPDGKKAALVKCGSLTGSGLGDSEIYVVNADGSGLTNVSNHPAADGFHCYTEGYGEALDWSPDGKQLVFFSSREPSGLYVVNADGTELHFLTNGVMPKWSPTGDSILFIGELNENAWNVDVHLISPDGSNKRLLAKVPCLFSMLGSSCWPSPVFWSPDGKLLVFYATVEKPEVIGMEIPETNEEIYVMNADGTGMKAVTNYPGNDREPTWVDCNRPTAGCSATVTNVLPDPLNVRGRPSTSEDKVAEVHEGDTVCIAGPAAFRDGFRWLPIITPSGAGGWSAAVDLAKPGELWLTPTGKTC